MEGHSSRSSYWVNGNSFPDEDLFSVAPGKNEEEWKEIPGVLKSLSGIIKMKTFSSYAAFSLSKEIILGIHLKLVSSSF